MAILMVQLRDPCFDSTYRGALRILNKGIFSFLQLHFIQYCSNFSGIL